MSRYSELLKSQASPSIYLTLDNVTALEDQSGNSRNGTGKGGLTAGGITSSPIFDETKSTDFSGSAQYVETSYAFWANGSTRSFGVWMWRDTTGRDCIAGGHGNAPLFEVGANWSGEGNNDDINFVPHSFATPVTWKHGWPGIQQWVFVGFTVNDSTGFVECFVNGKSLGSKSYEKEFSNNELRIGAWVTGEEVLDGRMAHFFGVESAVSAAKWETLYAGAFEKARQFSKSPSSQILTNVGSPAAGEHSMVAIVKYEEDGNIIKAVKEPNEDFAPGTELAVNLGGLIVWGTAPSPSISVPKGSWSLVGLSKMPGTVNPRAHLYDFATKTWIHRDGGERGEAALSNWQRFRIGGKTNAVGPWKGAIAAIARYDKALTDWQFEALPLAGAVGAWTTLSPSPVALWEFNQALVTEELKDLIGSAHQTSREETSVLAEAPPMKYGKLGEALGRFIKVLIGGAIKEAKRWVLVGGQLKSA